MTCSRLEMDPEGKRRILYLVHRTPYPPNKGDKIRSFHFLEHLAKEHEVYLAALVDDAADMDALTELGHRVTRLVYGRIDQPWRRLWALRAMLQGKPITLGYFYTSQLQRKIDSLIDEIGIDVILCSSSPMAEYLRRSRHRNGCLIRCRKVMDLIDVDSCKWRQYADMKSAPVSWLYRYEARRLARYECGIYDCFDELCLVSDREKKYFPRTDDDHKLHAIANGVDLDFFAVRPKAADPRGSPILTFTGMMDYWPNIEGMQWFIEDVYPKIRQAAPEARLYVVGGRPSREVREWDRIPGVTVTGFVDDVREYVAAADVCVAPLRIARGLQNKVLEYMAMGKPVVATSCALDGIGATPGVHLLAADDAEGFASSVLGLLRDRARSEQLGAEARGFVTAHCSWEGNLRQLSALMSGTGN